MEKKDSNFLDEIANKYFDELLGLFPVHRLFLFVLSIPLVAGYLDAATPGVISKLTLATPIQVLKFDDGTLWAQSWAAWGLIFSCYFVSLYFAGFCPRFFRSAAKKSQHREVIANAAKSAALAIEQSMKDSSNLRKYLMERCQKRSKAMATQQKCAELVLFIASELLLLASKWQIEDAVAFFILMGTGIGLHFNAYRFYLIEIAPSWVLLGYLEGSFFQLEDAYA